jgi:MoxR-like ATPase
MSETRPFREYRGDGTTSKGEIVGTPGEKGRYLADEDLVCAVNAMLAVEQPLLVTGDPGTGKTVLAYSIAAELELGDVELFTVRSEHQGRDLLYEFDNLQRFYDAQVEYPRARDRRNYLRLGPLGRVIHSGKRRVVLIDEIDKAPRDFPNDLLHVLDKMELRIPEIDVEVSTDERPVVVVTSNQESQLPEAFLRRCVFHHIEFPDEQRLQEIVAERLGEQSGSAQDLRHRVIQRFQEVRKVKGLQKRPATSELLTWVRVLERAQPAASELAGALEDLPFLGALLKLREDLDLVKPRRRERDRAAVA